MKTAVAAPVRSRWSWNYGDQEARPQRASRLNCCIGAWMGSRVSAPKARHGTTPMTLDIHHRSFVATAARVLDGERIRWVERWEDKIAAVSAKALRSHHSSVSTLRRQRSTSPLVRAASWIPAFAGMTAGGWDGSCPSHGVTPAHRSLRARGQAAGGVQLECFPPARHAAASHDGFRPAPE